MNPNLLILGLTVCSNTHTRGLIPLRRDVDLLRRSSMQGLGLSGAFTFNFHRVKMKIVAKSRAALFSECETFP